MHRGFQPAGNGPTGRMKKTLVNMLVEKIVKPLEWERTVFFVLCSYNTTPHEVTGKSSFFLLHALDPPSPERCERESTRYMVDMEDYSTELLEGLREVPITPACKNIRETQGRAKNYYEAHYHVKGDHSMSKRTC